MSTLYDLDDEVTELIEEIGKRLHTQRRDTVAIAVALLAARMKIPVLEDL